MDRKSTKITHGRRGKVRKRTFQGNQYTNKANETSIASTSAEKLQKTGDDEIHIRREHGYCILNFFSVFSAIGAFVICKVYQNNIRFSETSNRWLGFKIAVECTCDVQYINSSLFIDKAYEINRRLVFAMRQLGIGKKGINLFCGIMDIC